MRVVGLNHIYHEMESIVRSKTEYTEGKRVVALVEVYEVVLLVALAAIGPNDIRRHTHLHWYPQLR